MSTIPTTTALTAAATVTIPAAGPAPPPKKPFPWWILAVVGAVLVLVIGAIIAIVVMNGGSKVPSVVGQPYAEAVKALDKAGYKTIKRTDKETGEKPPETVLDQDPGSRSQGQEDRGDPADGRRAHAGGLAGGTRRGTADRTAGRSRLRPGGRRLHRRLRLARGRPQRPGLRHARVPLPGQSGKRPGGRASQSQRRSLRSGHLPAWAMSGGTVSPTTTSA
jgi:hypothetical protein